MTENGICWSSIMINYDVVHITGLKQQLATNSDDKPRENGQKSQF